MKNLLNSMRKRGGKTIICCFARGEKPPKPSWENGEENQMLIEDRDEEFDQRLKHNINI